MHLISGGGRSGTCVPLPSLPGKVTLKTLVLKNLQSTLLRLSRLSSPTNPLPTFNQENLQNRFLT